MFKAFAAALVLVSSIAANATSLAPEIAVLTCRSKLQSSDFSFQVTLAYLPSRPEGKPYLLSVSSSTLAGLNTIRELAVEMANPRMAGPIHYITQSYALDVENSAVPRSTVSANLRMVSGNQVALICLRAK